MIILLDFASRDDPTHISLFSRQRERERERKRGREGEKNRADLRRYATFRLRNLLDAASR